MRLSELIRGDLVKVDLEATNKWEAIEELVDLLISAHEIPLAHRQPVIEAIFERERELSTGLEHGLAVPHGRTACVDQTITALGISREGIPFETLDDRPARAVILLVLPKETPQRHVRTLACIAGLGCNADVRERIYRAPTVEHVMELIGEADEAQASAGR